MGRRKLREIDKIRATAWLWGAMHAYGSGNIGNFAKRFKINEPKMFYRFRDGDQKLPPELVDKVESALPATRITFDIGPNGAPLWQSMTANEEKVLLKCTRAYGDLPAPASCGSVIDHVLMDCFQEIDQENAQKPFHLLSDLLACHRLLGIRPNDKPSDTGRKMCTNSLLVRSLQIPSVIGALDTFELQPHMRTWIRSMGVTALDISQPVLKQAFKSLASRLNSNVTVFGFNASEFHQCFQFTQRAMMKWNIDHDPLPGDKP
jgi:hypothetical protein